MRIILAAALALGITSALAQSDLPAFERPQQVEPHRIPAGAYMIDDAHTQVTWSVDHMGFTTLEGMFGAKSGSLTIDPSNPVICPRRVNRLVC